LVVALEFLFVELLNDNFCADLYLYLKLRENITNISITSNKYVIKV
jgi:hypothetical protein